MRKILIAVVLCTLSSAALGQEISSNGPVALDYGKKITGCQPDDRGHRKRGAARIADAALVFAVRRPGIYAWKAARLP